MAVLKIRDENGNVHEILSLRGEKGDPGERGADGTVTFDELTDEQKESLRGEPGDSYILTEEDKAEITQAVLDALPNGDEVKY